MPARLSRRSNRCVKRRQLCGGLIDLKLLNGCPLTLPARLNEFDYLKYYAPLLLLQSSLRPAPRRLVYHKAWDTPCSNGSPPLRFALQHNPIISWLVIT